MVNTELVTSTKYYGAAAAAQFPVISRDKSVFCWGRGGCRLYAVIIVEVSVDFDGVHVLLKFEKTGLKNKQINP